MQKKVIMGGVSDPNANSLNRFAGDSAGGIKISPNHTLMLSVFFVLVVFVLHILGKLVGFATAPSTPTDSGPSETFAQDTGAEGAE